MFCVVVAEPSWERVFDCIRAEARHTDLFELRLDFLEEPLEERTLKDLFSLPYKFICTYRDHREGGRKRASTLERWKILELCGRLGAYLIDVEMRAFGEIKTQIKESGLFPERVLISYHNFEKTPVDGVLKGFLRRLRVEGVKRVKIATMARDLSEALRVLSTIPRGRELGLEVIAFGMGEGARLSRILNLLLGSPFTYVFPEQGKSVAPGQMVLSEAKKLYEVLSSV